MLDHVGARLQATWLREFLTNPQKAHPGTTMPDVLARDENRPEKIDHLVHFLVSQKSGWVKPKMAKQGSASQGERAFKRIGCAACHSDPIDGKATADPALVPLGHLREKYSHAGLTSFLQKPLEYRPSGRMPDLNLKSVEAADVSAYLLDTFDVVENQNRVPLEPFKVDSRKVEAGARVFSSEGCANCHQLGEVRSTHRVSRDLVAIAASGRARCSEADYQLPPGSLRDGIAEAIREIGAEERVRLSMAMFNCYACHSRDGLGGPLAGRQEYFHGDETLGNEGRYPPSLTGVGRKLKPAWLRRVLEGKGNLRPYLETRMPVFGMPNVGHLTADFAAADDAPLEDDDLFAGGNTDAGRTLMGTDGGVGCITCHGLGEEEGVAMKGMSLTGGASRYRPSWFKAHLIDPLKTKPGTLMPSFWPGGVAGNQSILGGDTHEQIAAIWNYLEDGKQLPKGFPTFTRGNFEIVVKERPVVQRTMMEGAGMHAVLVGFPEGIHFAFDAERCRLAAIWKGRFIDGYNAWFSRLQPLTKPLGTDVKWFPAGEAPFLFRGYTLDPEGIPTFLYRDDAGREFKDRIQPNGNGGFRRSISIDGKETVSEVTW